MFCKGLDPAVISDSQMAYMATKAVNQAQNTFKTNPQMRETSIKIDGYWFRVTRDRKTGMPNNVFPIIQ